MTGKLAAIAIVAVALIAGAAMYYLQVYAYYREVPLTRVELTSAVTGQPEPIAASDMRAIDADSSPLRFRACFRTTEPVETLSARFVVHDAPVPLVGPGWFDCFDAVAIGKALERGEATAFLWQADIHDGVDRVVAIFGDGRGFAWHQLNGKYSD